MELEFQSHQYSLYHLEHYFCYLMEKIPISSHLRDSIRLCFYEAVTNAVVHGNQYDANKYIRIQVVHEDQRLILSIQDEGDGFCIESLPSPLQSDNIEKTSGRGVYFVQKSCQECKYCNESKTLKMEWNLQSSNTDTV